MKKIIAVLQLICFVNSLHAQNNTTDSLKRLLSSAKEDTTRIDILQNIAWTYAFSNPDTALTYVQEALLLAKKNKSFKDRELYVLGQYGYMQGIIGNYPDAIKYIIQDLEYEEQVKNPTRIGTYGMLIETYCDNGDVSNAMLYLDKQKKLIAANDKEFQIGWLGLLAKVERKANRLDSALQHAQQAIILDIAVNGKNVKALLPLIIADIYLKKKDYSKALEYYKNTMALNIEQNTTKDLMDANNGLAILFQEEGQPDSCIYYAQQTLTIGKSNSYRLPLLEAYNILSGVYKSKNMMDSTVKYLELTNAIKDSLFNQAKEREIQNVSFNKQLNEVELQQKVEQTELIYKNRLTMYALLGGFFILLIIAIIQFRNNKHKQQANIALQHQKEKVESTLSALKFTQQQLIQIEKMASLGELTAGIAHEIQNPLNFVNNFSELSNELIDEMKEELATGNLEQATEIADDIKQNLEKINHHGKRAGEIVKGMQQHSRTSTGQKEPIDINKLTDEYLRLSYNGLRAKDKDLPNGHAAFYCEIVTDFDASIGNINIIPQEIGRVLLNLYNNAFYAVNEKRKQQPEGYEPYITVSTKRFGEQILISVKDNGNGIPQKIVDKIFQPFFTTKPTGQGTGLGLSLSYDIIKTHGGEIKVETTVKGSMFIIELPIT